MYHFPIQIQSFHILKNGTKFVCVYTYFIIVKKKNENNNNNALDLNTLSSHIYYNKKTFLFYAF